MGDDEKAAISVRASAFTTSPTILNASISRPESVSSMIAKSRLEHRELQHFHAFLFAAGKADIEIDASVSHQLSPTSFAFLAHELNEVRRGDFFLLPARLALRIHGRANESSWSARQGISIGCWKDRKRPLAARSSGSRSRYASRRPASLNPPAVRHIPPARQDGIRKCRLA